MASHRETELVLETSRRELKGIGVTVIVTLYNYEVLH